MTTVNNATGVFGTLGYNFDDPNKDIKVFSDSSKAHLNAMPAFISSWQAQDIVNNDVGGYFQNPTEQYVNTIINTSNSIVSLFNSSNNGIAGLETVYDSANTLLTTSQSFLAHTNRLSGITPWTGDNTVPYYQSALNYGKTAIYITNQTDGIQNNAPILGSFTSILIVPQIKSNSTILVSDNTIILNSLNYETDEGGNTVFTTTLTSPEINQIQSDISNTNILLSSRESADVNYFNNLKNFVNKFNTVKQFSNLGETGEDLINNYIGTSKIKNNLASQGTPTYTPNINVSNTLITTGGTSQNISDVINSLISVSNTANTALAIGQAAFNYANTIASQTSSIIFDGGWPNQSYSTGPVLDCGGIT
jgi:hypothetical protein